MADLSDDGRLALANADWISITTKKGNGFHTIAVWETVFLEGNKIGMFAGGMFQTKQNLDKDPHVELIAVSRSRKLGYRFVGAGDIIPKKDLKDSWTSKLQKKNPEFFMMSHSVLIINVSKSTNLLV